jgi:hypothetical protein
MVADQNGDLLLAHVLGRTVHPLLVSTLGLLAANHSEKAGGREPGEAQTPRTHGGEYG